MCTTGALARKQPPGMHRQAGSHCVAENMRVRALAW